MMDDTYKGPAVDAEATERFEANTIIFEEGDTSDCAYVVVEGRIELTKNVEGTDIFLAEIGPGDLFGEMGLIDGSERSATAMALDDAVLQVIDKDQLFDKLSSDSDFAAPVLGQLVRELRETSDRLAHERVLSLNRAADAAEVIVVERPSLWERLKGFFNTDQDFIEFQPDAVEIERQRTPAIVVVTLFVILGLVGGAFIWANTSSVDTAVSAQGRITTEVPNIPVQPSETAVIRSILVKEGDVVEEGQLLATLDATIATAGVTVSQSSLTSILAQERRLEAELSGQVPASGFSEDASENRLQQAAFVSRQDGLKKRLIAFDEQIRQIEAEIRTNEQDARDLGEQAEVLKEIEGMRSQLMDQGFGSRVNFLSAKHQRLSVDREQRRLQSDRTRLTHSLRATTAEREAALATWRSQVTEELVSTRRERERLTEQLTKSEFQESLVRLTAPAPGVVLNIADRFVGSVIQQAEAMFTIVPANVDLEMEVDVLPKDVGRIQVGDNVRIKLEALPFQKHGIIEGRVRLISEDAVEGEGPNAASVYKTRVQIGERKLRDVPDTFRLTPGLTGSADITVGKRKIITYFVYPIVRALDSSFQEP